MLDDQSLGGVIYYSRELDSSEHVFAIAHELGHFHLHWGLLTNCHRQDLDLDSSTAAGSGESSLLSSKVEVYNPRNLREREANAFALELLMPSDEVRFHYRHLIAEVAANRNPEQSPVTILAQHFEVSSYRMLMQLSNVFLASPVTVSSSELEEDTASSNEAPQPPQFIKLDEEQTAAVEVATPALVLAGPGSGKTKTLVERVRYLVNHPDNPVDPARLLVLTFSNKAAAELRERLAAAGLPAERMLISTFHAYGVEFLRRYAERIDLERDFRLLDPAHAYLLMEELLPYFPSGYYVNPHNLYGHLSALLTDISRAKDLFTYSG